MTVPFMTGATRIYNIVLQPYFMKYELDIDKNVEYVTESVKRHASKKFQVLLWHLFFTPTREADNLFFQSSLQSFNYFMNMNQNQQTTATNTLTKHETAVPSNDSSTTLTKKLLYEFIKLLNDGLYVKLHFCPDISTDSKYLGLCKIHGQVYHNTTMTSQYDYDHMKLLHFSREVLEDDQHNRHASYSDLQLNLNNEFNSVSIRNHSMNDLDSVSRAYHHQERINLKASHNQLLSFIIPLYFITQIDIDPDDVEAVIHIFISDYFYHSSYADNDMTINGSILKLYVNSQESDQVDESEALLTGLQLSLSHFKHRCNKIILKSMRSLVRIRLSRAFILWKNRGQISI
jgi:hypothetical protein